MRLALAFCLGAAFLFGMSQRSFGAASIWDNGASNWTTTFTDGDPVDTGNSRDAASPQLVVDSNGLVYVAFEQNDLTGRSHIYLSRYDGTDVRIWDNGASNWTTTFANGDPVDTGNAWDASSPQVAIDSNDIVYITYTQADGAGNHHIYLSRYDGTDVRIWDAGVPEWTATFAAGDPIDTGTVANAATPQLAMDSNNIVYVTYAQSFLGRDHIFLNRYDGTDVRIWDNLTSDWTDTFADGDPIDTGGANDASSPQLAVDQQDRTYVSYYQWDQANNHIYLSRYDGTDVRIWDNNTSDWTTSFANGDPVDTGNTQNAVDPQVAIDPNDILYVSYAQSFLGNSHIYLSRSMDAQAPVPPASPSGPSSGGGGGCFIETLVDGLGW